MFEVYAKRFGQDPAFLHRTDDRKEAETYAKEYKAGTSETVEMIIQSVPGTVEEKNRQIIAAEQARKEGRG